METTIRGYIVAGPEVYHPMIKIEDGTARIRRRTTAPFFEELTGEPRMSLLEKQFQLQGDPAHPLMYVGVPILQLREIPSRFLVFSVGAVDVGDKQEKILVPTGRLRIRKQLRSRPFDLFQGMPVPFTRE